MNSEQFTYQPMRAIEAPKAEQQEAATARRRETARHLAETALLDGFMPLPTPESSFEDIRLYIQDKVIEQQPAVDAIIEAMDAARVRSEYEERPMATFAFLGPTGVGKSQMAKTLADVMSRETGEGTLVKVDCSDYSQGHEIAKLVGAPPGYVGHDQPAYLNKERVEKPGTVVLFDEIEKASPPLYNLLLQIMEDGELQLKNGETTSFRDTIVILTSNLGAKEMSDRSREYPTGFGVKSGQIDEGALEDVAKRSFSDFFSPEFKNRIDKLVVFHPLSEVGLGQVLDVKLQEINQEYEDDLGTRISLSDATRQHLVAKALEERHLGARPLVRALKSEVLATFGRYVGKESISEGTHVRVFHRSEVPSGYMDDDQRQLVFASKPDASIQRRIRPEPVVEPEQESASEMELVEPSEEPGSDLVGPVDPLEAEA